MPIQITGDNIEISLLCTPIYTIFGKRIKYSLPDSAYGGWIIFENNQPKYYFNIFDCYYNDIRDVFNEQKKDIESILKNHNSNLSLSQNFIGFSFRFQEYIEKCKLEKLPKSAISI